MNVRIEKNGICVAVASAHRVRRYETPVITLVRVYLTAIAVANNIDIDKDTTGYDVVVDKVKERLTWRDCDIIVPRQDSYGYYSYLNLATFNECERMKK